MTHGVPWWSYIKARAITPGDREPTAAETAWQAFTSVAYGARGILHFTYHKAMVDEMSGQGASRMCVCSTHSGTHSQNVSQSCQFTELAAQRENWPLLCA